MSPSDQAQSKGETALALMEEALSLLTDFASPFEISAHLDLATCRLREALRLEQNADVAATGERADLASKCAWPSDPSR